MDVARRSLFTQTQAIRVTGTNIANVNTEGYSRRRAELVARQPQSIGNDSSFGTGVEIAKVVRTVDTFLNKELLLRISDRSQNQIRDEILSRAEAPFALDTTAGKIGFELSQFFGALEDLAQSPADISLRSRVVQKGESLSQSINSTFEVVAGLQREADSRIRILVDDVNRLSGEVASLNAAIAGQESGAQESLALRDQRDELLRKLAEHVSFQSVDNGDGTILVTLENGFGLVNGKVAREIEYTQAPTFAPVGGYPLGLDSAGLGHIVFDFDSSDGQSHIDLTQVIAAGSGEIAGLINLRGLQSDTDESIYDAQGDLVQLAARVESIARDLLTRFNQVYLGYDENLPGNGDENTGTADFDPRSGDLAGVPPEIFGLFTFEGAVDSDGDGLPTADDLDDIGLPNYARVIRFGVTDPARIAAALDLESDEASTAFATGDGENIVRLAALQDEPESYALGGFTATATVEELYDLTVSFAGALKSNASNNRATSQDREDQVRDLYLSTSGVSLDEEFAQLVNFQRAFQASARVIRIGDELLTQVLGLLG